MGTVERSLAGGLLWLGGISWKCLCGNLLENSSLGEAEWGVWIVRAET